MANSIYNHQVHNPSKPYYECIICHNIFEAYNDFSKFSNLFCNRCINNLKSLIDREEQIKTI